ncbi:uncharacterized protein LOC134533533 isoform X2 [Bacillus rossius redtenbacheri]
MAFTDPPNVSDLTTLHIIFTIAAVICMVEFFGSLFLIHAVVKNKRSIINLWLLVNTVIVIVYSGSLVVILMVSASMIRDTSLVIFAVTGCLILVLALYLLVVVLSYSKSVGIGGRVLSYEGQQPRAALPAAAGPYYVGASAPPPYQPRS